MGAAVLFLASCGVVITGAFRFVTLILNSAESSLTLLVARTATLCTPTSLNVGVQVISPVIALMNMPAGALSKENVGTGEPLALT